MSIQLPLGVQGGQVISVALPDGRQLSFSVPLGTPAGAEMRLWLDSAAGSLRAMDPVRPKESDKAAPELTGQVMQIQIPQDVLAGQFLAVLVPDGRTILVTVPNTAGPGTQLQLWFDSTAGTLTPLM